VAEDTTTPSTSPKDIPMITATFSIDITCVHPKPEIQHQKEKKRQEIEQSRKR
jgi:hypothetical protein